MKHIGPNDFLSACHVLKYVARLAVECLTNGLQSGEADGLCLARLQDGEVGLRNANLLSQFLRRHFPLCHHNIYINYYTHNLLSLLLDGQILFFLQILTHQYDLRDNHQGQTCNEVHNVALVSVYDIIVTQFYGIDVILRDGV